MRGDKRPGLFIRFFVHELEELTKAAAQLRRERNEVAHDAVLLGLEHLLGHP